MLQTLTARDLNDASLAHMEQEAFDNLPFGVIKLDPTGRVILYNATEASIARRAPERTLGRNFFEDVAPCTNVRAFRGRLQALRALGQRTTIFDYSFPFPWGTRKVRIRFWIGQDGSAWVFVTPCD